MPHKLSKLLVLPALTLSACQLPPSAGLAPPEVPVAAVVPATIASQAEADTAAAIARGDATNALSGAIALPVALRTLSSRPNGPLPVTLHVFRVTGQLVREARVSLFERDAQTVSFVVDGAPSDVPLVLAATIEPGMVLRALVPRSSAAQPARGQVVDVRSEVIALRAYQAGLLPPVALGGAAEVVRQGGLAPGAAAAANRAAAAALRSLAASWPAGSADATGAVGKLEALAGSQDAAAQALLQLQAGKWLDPVLGAAVYDAWLAAEPTLRAVVAKLSAAPGLGVPEVTALNAAKLSLVRAAAADVPTPAAHVAANQTFHLAQADPWDFMPVTAPVVNLMDLYATFKVGAFGDKSYVGADERPFSEAEIADALENGKGPYRTSCSQVSLTDAAHNCRVVVNPTDRAQEILVQREVDLLTKRLKELEAAVSANDKAQITKVLQSHPSLVNYIAADQVRWSTPAGVWRIRLLQDAGNETIIGGGAFPILSDSELTLTRATEEEDDGYGGQFSGVASIWMPDLTQLFAEPGETNRNVENLSNFALRFYWDPVEKALSEGVITGSRRDGVSGDIRTTYSAIFEGTMGGSTRVSGHWINAERRMAGRFEMIRGTTKYTI